MNKILRSEIHNLPGTTYVKLYLEKGAKLKAQLFSVRAFSSGISYYEKTATGEEKIIRSRIVENATYVVIEAKENGWIILSHDQPGYLVECECEEMIAAVKSFFCAETDFKLGAYEIRNRELRYNCKAGGEYWQHYINPSRQKFYMEFDESAIRVDVQPGESIKVYRGYWLASEGGLKMSAVGDDVKIENPTSEEKIVYMRAFIRS